MSYLGLDLGGTKVAARLVGPRGRYDGGFLWPPGQDPERDLGALRDLVSELVAAAGEPPRHAGVALPATLDAGGRVVAWPNRPAWTGVGVAEELGRATGAATVRYADDGSLAALAEARAAACDDLAYLGVGTGVGSGIVSGGRLLTGAGGAAVELGHVLLASGGPRCTCGRDGCVQATASAPATLARASRLRGAETAAQEFVAGLDARQPWALAALEETAAALGLAVVLLTDTVQPRRVHIGGGLGAAAGGLARAVARRCAPLVRAGRAAPVVSRALLDGQSSLHGAVLLAREHSLIGTEVAP